MGKHTRKNRKVKGIFYFKFKNIKKPFVANYRYGNLVEYDNAFPDKILIESVETHNYNKIHGSVYATYECVDNCDNIKPQKHAPNKSKYYSYQITLGYTRDVKGIDGNGIWVCLRAKKLRNGVDQEITIDHFTKHKIREKSNNLKNKSAKIRNAKVYVRNEVSDYYLLIADYKRGNLIGNGVLFDFPTEITVDRVEIHNYKKTKPDRNLFEYDQSLECVQGCDNVDSSALSKSVFYDYQMTVGYTRDVKGADGKGIWVCLQTKKLRNGVDEEKTYDFFTLKRDKKPVANAAQNK